MPKPFHQLTLEQFIELLDKFPFTRRIESVHMHHTWRPNREQYSGLGTIESMWEFHTQTQGWSDIAQHVSIAPDGSIWTGRSWNQAPASAKGFNGNAVAGPFMLETIGDFDEGKDPFGGAQKQTVLAVIAHVQKRFDLKPETLRFHNTMSSKSCPGSALDYDDILEEVAALHAQLDKKPAASKRAVDFPFEDRARAVWQIIDHLSTPSTARTDDEGEGCAHDESLEAEVERSTVAPPPSSLTARGKALSPELLRKLRPHVINLNQGRLSTSGEFRNDEADVDAVFEDHLVRWARGRKGQKLPILFYAHGGLISEQRGLLTAHGQVRWWLENGVYPIHFVWETGLMETLGQLLNPRRRRAIDFAAPSDFALETLARGIGGGKIWAGMKVSAERASAEHGGARYAARKLKEFCAKAEFKDRIELHAIGHSAGSIFHAHFVPTALDAGAPEFKSLQFLAPAIRVDDFEELLLKRMGAGKGIDVFNVFTMARDFERDDNCFTIYRKSLLYLIYYALEPDRKTPILGLEESIRRNARLKRLFGLDGKRGSAGEVIWSVSKEKSGRSATTSRTHGGFDNDAPTMQSMAQRILGHEVTPFPHTESRGLDVLESLQVQEPTLSPLFALGAPSVAIPGAAAAHVIRPEHAAGGAGGRKRALCIGIDSYLTAPLGGCANDAREWRAIFQALGFEEPQLLLNGEGTRSAILEAVTELLRASNPGDVLAVQFAGHGTQLPDLDGDEADGDTPGWDEALCPIDYDRGHFVLDDDLATIFDQIPAGVSVTIFADCCHSGSNTRLAIGAPPIQVAGRDVRKRFLPATREMKEAHAAFRGSLGESRAVPAGRGAYDQAREVLFAACRSSEVALESDGHGHFTTRATRLLATGIQNLTNADFQAGLVRAFGENSGQNPELHCAAELRSRALLAPMAAADGGAESNFSGAGAAISSDAWRTDLARLLENAARFLRN